MLYLSSEYQDIGRTDHHKRQKSANFPANHLWLDAGYTGENRGAGWVEDTLGWSAEIVRHPKKPAPEEVMMKWAR